MTKLSVLNAAYQYSLTHERDRLDVRVVADEVDGVVLAVDDVDDAVGHAGLPQELDERHARGGVPLGGLHHVRVAADGAHREHPEIMYGRSDRIARKAIRSQ